MLLKSNVFKELSVFKEHEIECVFGGYVRSIYNFKTVLKKTRYDCDLCLEYFLYSRRRSWLWWVFFRTVLELCMDRT